MAALSREFHIVPAAQLDFERVRAQLLRADRMSSLGALAGGIGHELNNLATLIQAVMIEVGDALAEQRPPAPDAEEDLQAILDHLVLHGRQLMHFARDQADRVERTDLRRLVGSTLDMLHSAGRTKYLKLERDFTDQPLDGVVARSRVEQLVVNLVNNAADAVARPGAFSKWVRVRVFGEPSGAAVIQVEDDGPGVPEPLREAIFAPYFTTKEPGRGTGLGLAVARQIAESFGGELVLAPSAVAADGGARVPRGAAFCCRLPGRPESSLGGAAAG